MSGPIYTIAEDEASGLQFTVELDSHGCLEFYVCYEGRDVTICLDADEALALENIIDGHASNYIKEQNT